MAFIISKKEADSTSVGDLTQPHINEKRRQLFIFSGALTAAIVLPGCGGGGSGTAPLSPTTTPIDTVGPTPPQPVDISVPPMELPDHIKPINYKIWFRPNAALDAFKGRADIEINITKQTGEISLAAHKIVFDPAQITLTSLADNSSRSLVVIPQSQGDFYDLRDSTGTINPGKYVLHMEWSGEISAELAQGVFKIGLQAATGEISDAIVTQGESNFARQWFPCWDEPAFRSTFELTAEVPGFWKAVSNGKETSATKLADGYQRVVFAKTPAMPSYLLFFGGGKFDILEDTFTNPLDGTSMRLRWWVPPGEALSATHGMQYTKESLNYYYNYFKIPLPFDKMDTIAANDGNNSITAGFGGMENWGAIFEFASTVLIPPVGATTSLIPASKSGAFYIVSHELAHQWFGDLVTHDWWDNIWLNESFASWFATVSAITLHPELAGNSWDSYATAKQNIYLGDLLATSVPVQHNLSSNGAMDFLDVFAYEKGGHILQMLENFIGKSAMQKGLQAYLNKYKFGNGTPPRLWAELDAASGLPVGKVGDSFVRQTGVPTIYIDSQCNPSTNENVLTITQSALPSANVNSGRRWNIPITLAYGVDFAQTKTVVLDQPSAQFILPSCSAVLANPSGLDYYVSNYSPALWSALLAQVDAIKNTTAKVNILGDATKLKAAGLITQVQFDQIAKIKKPQAAAQILRQGAVPDSAVVEPIHKFRYQGVMKHRSE